MTGRTDEEPSNWNPISVADTAKRLGLSEDAVRGYIQNGFVPAKKVGNRWVVDGNQLGKAADLLAIRRPWDWHRVKHTANQIAVGINLAAAFVFVLEFLGLGPLNWDRTTALVLVVIAGLLHAAHVGIWGRDTDQPIKFDNTGTPMPFDPSIPPAPDVQPTVMLVAITVFMLLLITFFDQRGVWSFQAATPVATVTPTPTPITTPTNVPSPVLTETSTPEPLPLLLRPTPWCPETAYAYANGCPPAGYPLVGFPSP